MDNYLDVNKSVVISSPAGSGKTEKLARRYIALLESGVEVERILAITFTERASAEMKQRILKILKEEDSALFRLLLEKMSLMRVSTIHSFCGTLLRRFSFEAATAPNYRIEDEIDALINWEAVLYEIIMEAGKGGDSHEMLLQTLGEKGFRGLEHLKTAINKLFAKRPSSLEAEIPAHSADISLEDELIKWPGAGESIENYISLFKNDAFNKLVSAEKLFLTDSRMPRKRTPSSLKNIRNYQDWAIKMSLYWRERNIEEHMKRGERIMAVFSKCLARYSYKKYLRGTLDFSDLEYLSYKLLMENPEWANILYAFDEKTDHILVDEFQDTNNFQWAIIDRLTEEWRSGIGAKRGEGITPTIFLVGDEKQSIYFFRGANVEIFQNAKKKLRDWLGQEFYYGEAKENYRSGQAIIDLTNHVFSRIMQADEDAPPWITRYSPFHACRKDSGEGKVEIILLDPDIETTAEVKQREADIIAKRIQGLAGKFEISDRSAPMKRPCRYMDMALLLRKRTHLKKYEEALRQHDIPFVAVKGIGFYQEPEVAILRSLIYFFSNPKDDYSLYLLLKSPLFSIDEATIIMAIDHEGDCLYSKLKRSGMAGQAVSFLEDWLTQLPYTPVSELIEMAFVRTRAWEYFHEAQRKANVKKFIRVVEDLEAEGKSLMRISDFLEITQAKADEPKANVNAEGMDAVRIMTIHASKGLEFPVVFVPGIEEGFGSRPDDSLIYDSGDKYFFKYEPDSAIRRSDSDFLSHQAKEEEEQKRLLYVSVTRAEEALLLTGQWLEGKKNFLGYLIHSLGLENTETGYSMSGEIKGLSLLSELEAHAISDKAPKPKAPKPLPSIPDRIIPLDIRESVTWKPVTETVNIRRRHGKDWLILGDVIHKLLEEISKGILPEQDINVKAEKLLVSKGVIKGQIGRLISMMEKDVSLLKEKGIWQDVIIPKQDSYSELPFVLGLEKTVYSGRIDRLIKDGGSLKIYDYKTFPVKDDDEMRYLLREYAFQMDIYKKAAGRLFSSADVRSYIIFTHMGEVREVK